MKVFSVHDQKAECYLQPFFARTSAEAMRMFFDEASNEKSMMARHPEDFVLFLIGEFDDQQTGRVVPEEPPIALCRATDATRES